MQSALPDPPYHADTRVKGWRFELDTERIRSSDTWALCPQDFRPWLLMLWMTAWDQCPAGTLPADHRLIAAHIGMDTKQFERHADILLRGFVKHSDGRLYHPVITDQTLRLIDRRENDAGRKRGYDQRFARIKDRDGRACVYCGATTYLSLDHLIPVSQKGGHEESNLVCACKSCNSLKGARTPDEANMQFVNLRAKHLWEKIRASKLVTVGNAGVTVGNAGRTLPEPEPEPEPEHSSCSSIPNGSQSRAGGCIGDKEGCRGTAQPEKVQRSRLRGERLTLTRLPQEWLNWCASNREDLDPLATWDVFRDYWTAKSGEGGTKVDWFATWRNWVRRQDAAKQTKQAAPFMTRQQQVEANNAALLRKVCGETIDGEYEEARDARH